MLKKENKKGIAKSQRTPEDEVREELGTLYITSTGDRYAKKDDAVFAETEIQKTKKSKEKRRKVIMTVVEILLKALKQSHCGVYYKTEPIQTLIVQDGSPLLKVNEVDDDTVEEAILGIINEIQPKELQNWIKKERKAEDTHLQLPTDLKQKKS